MKIRWDLEDPTVETTALANATVEILQATDCDVVFDRAYFSLWAYGPALGHDVGFMLRSSAEFEAAGPPAWWSSPPRGTS